MTPNAWFATVVGTLAMRTSPLRRRSTRRSVKVPPTSIPAILRVVVMGVRAASYAQVGARIVSSLHQRVHRAVVVDRALLDHDGAVGDGRGEVQVLLREQDRDALAPSARTIIAPSARRSPARGLPRARRAAPGRVAHQRARDREHLLLAAGHRGRPARSCIAARLGKSAKSCSSSRSARRRAPAGGRRRGSRTRVRSVKMRRSSGT